MITETQMGVIVLQLTDALLAQLQPFMAGLDIAVTTHHKAAEPGTQRLSMSSEVYEALAERVGSALDYDIRWQRICRNSRESCRASLTVARLRHHPNQLDHGSCG